MMPHPQNTEDPDQQIDSTIIKLAENYASCDRRSAEINDERKTIRENAEKLGIPSKAFQHAVGMVKHMSEGERRDYTVGMNRVIRAIEGRQNELFPAEAERIRKRTEPKKTEAAPVNSDTNPRSDPNKGGAKPRTIKEAAAASQAAVDASIAQVEAEAAAKPGLRVVGTDAGEMKQPDGVIPPTPPNPPNEQAEGEAALKDGLPLSQSAQAAAKREQAKLN